MKKLLASLAFSLLLATPVFAVEYHGNPESKIFHHPDCQHYASPKATEKFTSKEQAIKANYKPCKTCFVEKDGKVESKAQIKAKENLKPGGKK